MKKVFVILIVVAAITACTGVPKNATGATGPETAGNGVTQAETPALSPEPEFDPQADISTVALEEIEEPSPPETASPIAAVTAEPEPELETAELTEAETGEIPVDITVALPSTPEEPPTATPSAPSPTPPAATPPVTVTAPTTPPAVAPPVTVTAPTTPPAATPPPVAVSPPSTPPLAAVTPPPVTPSPASPAARPTPVTPPAVTPPPAPPSPAVQPAVPRPVTPIQNTPETTPEIPPAVSPPGVEADPPPASRETVPRVIQGIPYPSVAVTGRENDDSFYSRIVQAEVGQIVEIPFRGTGWVYLGETDGRRGVFYESRRFDPEGQSFIFRVDAPGIYTLKFYRQDFIRNFIFNDHVQLIVTAAPETAGRFGPPADRGRVVAEPRWPTTIEEAAAIRGRQQVPAETDTAPPAASPSAVQTATVPTTPPAATTPVVTPPATAPTTTPPAATTPATPARTPPPTAPSVPTTPAPVAPAPLPTTTPPVNGSTVTEQPAETSPYSYLEKAREEYDADRIVSALSFLNRFREHFPSGSDEAWWLYGQCYEATSPARDILAALEYYRRVVQDYPQSPRANEARRRISYLERLYINIR